VSGVTVHVRSGDLPRWAASSRLSTSAGLGSSAGLDSFAGLGSFASRSADGRWRRLVRLVRAGPGGEAAEVGQAERGIARPGRRSRAGSAGPEPVDEQVEVAMGQPQVKLTVERPGQRPGQPHQQRKKGNE